MKCCVCEATMNPSQDWLFSCRMCGFEMSTLESGSGRGVDGLEPLRRDNFQTLLDRLEQVAPVSGTQLLEVGCAEGWFLEAASARGAHVQAVEPSKPHAEMAAGNGFKVRNEFFPQAVSAEERFDFIVFNDVFEHLPEPVPAIQACENHLNPGGILVLNVPSNSGVIYRTATMLNRLGKAATLDRLWQKGFTSPHITYFNPDTLHRFVARHTELLTVDQFPLASFKQEGLKERIEASHDGIIAQGLYWTMRLTLPILLRMPSDITVGVFRKPEA